MNGLVNNKRLEFKRLAAEAGFELAGVAHAGEVESYPIYQQWVTDGMAGPMGYLTGHRAELRRSARNLLPSAQSVLCLGKLYNSAGDTAGVSRYAWGSADYHDVVRQQLEVLTDRLKAAWGPFEYKLCVDTAPLLERAYAHMAGLGWIGRNTCLINEPQGSWFFLSEILISIDIEVDVPPPDRCGTCRRCVDACPTQALVPAESGRGWQLDPRLCISTWTIEQRGVLPEEHRALSGSWIFGCDICQDVCPWNRRAPESTEPGFRQVAAIGSLDQLASLTAAEFRTRFRTTTLWRMKYEGMLRNVCTAMGNSGNPEYRPALERLSQHEDAAVREHALWALARFDETKP